MSEYYCIIAFVLHFLVHQTSSEGEEVGGVRPNRTREQGQGRGLQQQQQQGDQEHQIGFALKNRDRVSTYRQTHTRT